MLKQACRSSTVLACTKKVGFSRRFRAAATRVHKDVDGIRIEEHRYDTNADG